MAESRRQCRAGSWLLAVPATKSCSPGFNAGIRRNLSLLGLQDRSRSTLPFFFPVHSEFFPRSWSLALLELTTVNQGHFVSQLLLVDRLCRPASQFHFSGSRVHTLDKTRFIFLYSTPSPLLSGPLCVCVCVYSLCRLCVCTVCVICMWCV